ncbi:Ecdysteroid kinase-domain-containing protein [Camillea tinctor]|nr:Ecdysteroid kinase-domain-containing protein [Camillea tinctor]
MATPIKASEVASILLSPHSLDLTSCTPLQSLWAGYGHICAITARAQNAQAGAQARRLLFGDDHNNNNNNTPADDTFALVLKLIAPPSQSSADEGHLRKMLSYAVEQYFYARVAPRLPPCCPVARPLASTRDHELPGLTATLMADLRPRFPAVAGRRGALSPTQVRAALSWLAGFHRSTRALLREDGGNVAGELVLPPLVEYERRKGKGKGKGDGVWLNGGYTYLATRRRELAALAADAGSEWSGVLCGPRGEYAGLCVAEVVAGVLAPRKGGVGAHESLIHGDVKSENLFASAAGDVVAFYDFQYVGLGLGVCDLAKLFTCSVPLGMLVEEDEEGEEELGMGMGERALLERYREGLLEGGEGEYEWALFVRHWETALVDWLRFQASWGFWGNTEWLEARVRAILKDEGWRSWLYEQHVASQQEEEQALPN